MKRAGIRMTGIGLAAIFLVVGIIFLVVPGQVLSLFNRLGALAGWPESPTAAYTLYLALAAGYMWTVTVLAWRMARHPEVSAYPSLLVHAKAASALICLALFVLQAHYAIYLANFLVDGLIAAFVWFVALRGRAGLDEVVSGGVPGQRRNKPATQPAERE